MRGADRSDDDTQEYADQRGKESNRKSYAETAQDICGKPVLVDKVELDLSIEIQEPAEDSLACTAVGIEAEKLDGIVIINHKKDRISDARCRYDQTKNGEEYGSPATLLHGEQFFTGSFVLLYVYLFLFFDHQTVS